METIKVAIGLFAHNEQDNILNTLESLATQNIFEDTSHSGLSIALTVVANGCTDNTVAIAREYLGNSHIFDGQVVDIAESGKSNAWNKFIHDDINSNADYFFCMDSDIRFGSNTVLSSLLVSLANSPTAYLAVDLALKDTYLKKQKSPYEYLSLFFSQLMKQGSTAVAGSLYCAKAARLRKVTMPKGLPVEDGFLRAMLVTDLFTKQDNNQRVLVVDDVCHYFTPEATLKGLLRHEERLLIGTFINSVIYKYLWAEVNRTDKDAGQLIVENNDQNPNWVENLIKQHREDNKHLIPRHFYFKYWVQWKSLSGFNRVTALPVLSIASVVKYFLLKKIERRLATESGLGYW
ncbi:glycosyltransferase [SAR92 clade bacterium H231]|nr:glycosyltransferase [SAR92 clade bacterium H231]